MPNDNEPSNDGWVQVTRGKKHKPVPSRRYSDPPLRDYDLEQLTKAFDAASKKWRASSCREETLRILTAKRLDQGWNISEALCLASGSFSRENLQNRNRSLLQFAAFVDLVHYLEKDPARSSTQQCKGFAQDPRYTELDESFIASLGFEVLPSQLGVGDGPELGEAVEHIKPATFVFEPFLEVSAETLTHLCRGSPTLYIGSSLSLPTAPKLEVVANFQKERRSYRFPLFEEDRSVFEGLFIWWVEADDS